MMALETTDEVIDALGGNGPTGVIVGVTSKAVSNWRKAARGRFPPETFVALTQALSRINKSAPASLWGMLEAKDGGAEMKRATAGLSFRRTGRAA